MDRKNSEPSMAAGSPYTGTLHLRFNNVLRELEQKKPQLDELVHTAENLRADTNRQQLHGKGKRQSRKFLDDASGVSQGSSTISIRGFEFSRVPAPIRSRAGDYLPVVTLIVSRVLENSLPRCLALFALY
ncbi:dystrophin-like [Vespula squamosa]|uniref:Dystrophin-like n=1 Tax=Vespula squamosa TaxID=30214 RepID=A0ABD2AVB3_VESSQ